jgi:hypothetical protein
MYQKLQVTRAKEISSFSDTEDIYYNTPGDNKGCVLYIGTGGSLSVITANGDEVEFKNLPDGIFLPVQILRILDVSDCTDIIALW